jgi:superoxide dismutase
MVVTSDVIVPPDKTSQTCESAQFMFTLPDLTYDFDALAPTISARALHIHHDKHHGAYLKVLNALVAEAGGSSRPLEQIILEAAARGEGRAWRHPAPVPAQAKAA